MPSCLDLSAMSRVVHFEIYTNDPEAVRPFYENVFGWKIQRWSGGPMEYWTVMTGNEVEPGINGGLLRPREGQSPGTLNTVAVPAIDPGARENQKARRPGLRAKDGHSNDRLASLRGRSSWQRLWNSRTRFGGWQIIGGIRRGSPLCEF